MSKIPGELLLTENLRGLFTYPFTKLSEIMVGKVATQCVAAAGRSQEARFTFAYYKGNRP